MQFTTLNTSKQARYRQTRRNLSIAERHFVIEHGQRIYCAGAMHIFLGHRDIPCERQIYQRYAHLEGTALILNVESSQAFPIIAYRNQNELKKN